MTLAVIIPTHNGREYIDPLITSILEQTCPVHQIIVVDNASSDDTVSRLSKYAGVTILAQSSNKGFGSACNIGMQKAIDDGAQIVFLLNQDVHLKHDAIGELVALMSKHDDFGMISSFQLSYDGKAIDPLFRRYPPPELWKELFDGTLKEIYSCNFMPAAFVAIRTRALLQCGGFDPLFFMYAEDVDLCDRFLKFNWKIGVSTKSIFFHAHGLVMAKRDWRFDKMTEFAHGLLSIKRYNGSLFHAFKNLLSDWFPVRATLRITVIRAMVLIDFIKRLRSIRQHRLQIPFQFTQVFKQQTVSSSPDTLVATQQLPDRSLRSK